MRSSASCLEKAPQDRSMSVKQQAMQPSTLRMRLARLRVVSCSTARAKSRMGVSLNSFLAKFLMISTRMSGFASDLIRWPIPMISWFVFFMLSMKSLGETPLSYASENIFAASSSAPPKRGPMVSSPLHSAETRSLPALADTIVQCAPLTAGPWSAVTMRIISMKVQQAAGSLLRNQRRLSTPPRPRSSAKTSEMGMPQYFSSSPRSSEMEEMKLAGFRTRPSFLAHV
mmetsp:Transcript_101299/g.295031  ORF Transcript_101299/g.295031 Transcript_101299/m.295031 type:complete len:228 (-) Transcript_101299:2462-3145(-)